MFCRATTAMVQAKIQKAISALSAAIVLLATAWLITDWDLEPWITLVASIIGALSRFASRSNSPKGEIPAHSSPAPSRPVNRSRPGLESRSELLDRVIELMLNAVGLNGLLLIVYGFLSRETNGTWIAFEAIADWLAVVVTLVAVIAIALSIFLPPVSRPPELRSKYVTVPIVLSVVVFAVVYMVVKNQILPQHTTIGFAILGLTGALFRTVSHGRHTPGGSSSQPAA